MYYGSEKDVEKHSPFAKSQRKNEARNKALGKKMGHKPIKLEKGRGREGSMEHKATGLNNTRALFD